MSRRRSRGLSPEEQDLWDRYTRRARPLAGGGGGTAGAGGRPRGAPTSAPATPRRTQPEAQPAPIPPFEIGERAQPGRLRGRLAGSVAEPPHDAPPAMDRRAYDKLRRGRTEPEARIDLHGMTLDEAHGALDAFMRRAAGRGCRLVLVITGKGRSRDDTGPIPERTGVLRRQVPVWLRRGPVSGLVLQVAEAHRRHGGAGAFYVYLRRQR